MSKKITVFISSILFFLFVGGVLVIFYLHERGEKNLDLKEIELNYSHDLVSLNQPKSGQEVASPLVLSGQARGFWFFEGSFPVHLYDEQGLWLATGIAQAQSDWMTEEPVNFRAEINFLVSERQPAWLVLEKDNPSGQSELADQFTVPIVLLPSALPSEVLENNLNPADNMVLNVYFNQVWPGAESVCEQVRAVSREIPLTMAPARAILEELLRGPSFDELEQGYFSSIGAGVRVQSLNIDNGVARVDFSSELDQGVAGSCRVQAIREQISATLLQFSTVTEVLISINGQSEDILQP